MTRLDAELMFDGFLDDVISCLTPEETNRVFEYIRERLDDMEDES